MNAATESRRRRIAGLTVIVAAFFALTAARLLIVVLVDGPRLALMARSEHHGQIALAAVRGPIVDRFGKALALSAETQSVYARSRQLLESSTQAERAEIADELGIEPEALENRLHKSSFVWLARHLRPDQASRLNFAGVQGIGTVAENQRFYPEGSLAAAVVGMAGVDGQGLSGTELQYDRFVRGEPVLLQFYHDALGHPILDSPVELRSAQPGARLELTLDASIQSEAEEYLAGELAKSGARRASAVVLNPFTGEVLALADVSADGSPKGARLHDAAVQDAFEPGSTMKGLLGAIALDNHVLSLGREIYCEHGQWSFDGKKIHDDSPHDWLDLGGIIEVSSNIGAAKIALALGAERFHAGLAAFGLGRKTGIDLPGESGGVMRPVSSWKPIDLANHGFGQGIAVTPIQLATAYAAIANGGAVMRPYVVKAAYDADGQQLFQNNPQVTSRALSPETAHAMNLLLRNVVDAPDGTGRLAQVADFTVAGKTGTAQMVNPATGAYYQSRLVASFVGFVPAQDPRLVILVVLYDVQHGHFGGLFAAPVFSEIASSALQRLEVTPPDHPHYESASILPFTSSGAFTNASPDERQDPDANAEVERIGTRDNALDEPGSRITPSFVGLSLRGAIALARTYHLNISTHGAGYVVAQSPAPDSPAGRAVQLKLSSNEDGSEPPVVFGGNERLARRSRRSRVWQ